MEFSRDLGITEPKSLQEFMKLPLNHRAVFMTGVCERALKIVERQASTTSVPPEIYNTGIINSAQYLLDERFEGSPTVGAVNHATDNDRGSLRRFETEVAAVERMLERPDMAVEFYRERTPENSRYTVFPELGIVFRDRTLAKTVRGGVDAVLAKRTVAVYNPLVVGLRGGFSYRPQRRDATLYHGARIPDIYRLNTQSPLAPNEDNTENRLPVINQAVLFDELALMAIRERAKGDLVGFAGSVRNTIASDFGIDDKNKHKPPYVYLDAFEHAKDPLGTLQIFDRAIIDAPRDPNPAKRTSPWLHVVSSQLYFKDLPGTQ